MSTRFDPPERGPLGPEVTTVVAAPIVPPASESAVSWGAIFAGAAAAAALSLILLILGVGLGLSSVSPWSFEGVSKEPPMADVSRPAVSSVATAHDTKPCAVSRK